MSQELFKRTVSDAICRRGDVQNKILYEVEYEVAVHNRKGMQQFLQDLIVRLDEYDMLKAQDSCINPDAP